jgi:DNA replication protein DnaC
MPSSNGCPGVPRRYVEASFENFDTETVSQETALEAATAIRDAILTGPEALPRTLVLIGDPGVGKSHLAAALAHSIARALLEKREKVRAAWEVDPDRDKFYPAELSHSPRMPIWVNVPALVVDLKAEIRLPNDEQTRTGLARALRDVLGLVILDDLGRERISEWTGELLYTIINSRYEELLPTIVTSNLDPDMLTDAGYWPAISRLAEDGRLVYVKGPDHRLQ